MTTQAQAQTAIDLASKWIGKGIGTMVSSAQHCLDDATARMQEGRYDICCTWAKSSLAYSVGIFHPDYKSLEGDTELSDYCDKKKEMIRKIGLVVAE